MKLDKKYVYLKGQRDSKTGKNPKRRKANLIRNRLTAEQKKQLRYEQFVPVYELWCEYFSKSLPNDPTTKPDIRVTKADFHGALLMVTEADNKSQIGIYGIVALETRHTVQLITRDNEYKIIPKLGTMFQFVLNGRIFSLLGDQMRQRPELRGKKSRRRNAVLRFFIR